jgi:hypothetical protein
LWFQVRIKNIDIRLKSFSRHSRWRTCIRNVPKLSNSSLFFEWMNELVVSQKFDFGIRCANPFHRISQLTPIHSNLWAVYFWIESKIGWYRNYSTILVNFLFNAFLNFEQKRIDFWNHSFHSHNTKLHK